MKRLLVIANLHHASPRIPALTYYLAGLGWEVTILTTRLGENPEYALGFPEGFRDRVKIIEAPYPGDALTTLRNLLIKIGFSQRQSFTEQIKEKFGVRKRRSWVDRALWLYQEFFAFPDAERTWRASALNVARSLMTNEPFDILLSSSPYPTSHVVASKLQKQFGIKWVADFRDTWTNNPVYPFSNTRRMVESRYEKKILRQASALTTVSEDYARALRHLHSQPVHVIPNGYQGKMVSRSSRKPNGKFTLTYTGMVYVGQQAPEKPIKALKQLIDTGVIDRQDVEIRFYGRKDRWIQVLIEDLGLSDVVIQYGLIPRTEAKLRQQDSELLLFLNWEDSQNKGLSHLKFYEYLSAGCPILATGGESGSEVENILRETQTGIYASSERDIERALTDLYQEYKRNGRISYQGNPESISRYSYLERAKALNNILQTLHNGPTEKSA